MWNRIEASGNQHTVDLIFFGRLRYVLLTPPLNRLARFVCIRLYFVLLSVPRSVLTRPSCFNPFKAY